MPLQGITRIKARTEKKICQLPKTAQSAASTEVAMIAPRPHLLTVLLMDEHMQYKGTQAKESSQRREVENKERREERDARAVGKKLFTRTSFSFSQLFTLRGERLGKKPREQIGRKLGLRTFREETINSH